MQPRQYLSQWYVLNYGQYQCIFEFSTPPLQCVLLGCHSKLVSQVSTENLSKKPEALENLVSVCAEEAYLNIALAIEWAVELQVQQYKLK